MKKLINNLAINLHESMEDDIWGTIRLPQNHDITFEITGQYELELRKVYGGGSCSVLNKIHFPILQNGKWITIEGIEKQLERLFDNLTFSQEEIEDFYKES
ncbi:hypothetical protein [Gottfriedia solisilvae]|uniref:hypothetical protein n=1 Tax=Gottfriedia solisilvae TaxID=1516104 RepID=UPI003D2EB423